MLSVLVCTHNPKGPLLARTMRALQDQDLTLASYDLLVIDNASSTPVSSDLVAWHPHGRVIQEPRVGLTNARLRGICETRGDLIVFVDDDNILAPNYLSVAAALASNRPELGAFGGSIAPEFEVPPPSSILPYIEYMACSELKRDYWCNFDYKWSTPSGAGLCVRRSVAMAYKSAVEEDPVRRALGRTGSRLLSGEDHDLALTSTDLGLGVGRFKDLRLTHVLPAARLNEEYVIRLYAGIGQCTVVLEAIRPQFSRKRSRVESLRRYWHLVRGSRFERRLILNRLRAENEARRTLAKILGERQANGARKG